MIVMRRADTGQRVDPSRCGFCQSADLPTVLDYLRAIPAGYAHTILLTDNYGRILAKRDTDGKLYRWHDRQWQPI